MIYRANNVKSFLLLALFASSLASCYKQERYSMGAGLFVGFNKEHSLNCTFEVRKIAKSSFESAGGKNVVTDHTNGNHFSVSFSAKNDIGETYFYTFENLVRDYKGVVFYKDDNGAEFTPFQMSDSKDTSSKTEYEARIPYDESWIVVTLSEVEN